MLSMLCKTEIMFSDTCKPTIQALRRYRSEAVAFLLKRLRELHFHVGGQVTSKYMPGSRRFQIAGLQFAPYDLKVASVLRGRQPSKQVSPSSLPKTGGCIPMPNVIQTFDPCHGTKTNWTVRSHSSRSASTRHPARSVQRASHSSV